jgi:hypothetical protein
LNITKELCAKIAGEVDGYAVDVQLIATSAESCFKAMSEEEMMLTLPAAIELIALSYCGAVLGERLMDTVMECYDFLKDGYPALALEEIKRAFVLATNGTIEADLIAYYGNFTVGMLGKVLMAYMVYRNRIQNRLKHAEKVQLEEEKERKLQDYYKSPAGQQQVDAYYEGVLKRYVEAPELHLQQVSSRVYVYLEKMGRLQLTPAQKWAYFDRAKELYAAELVSELGNKNMIRQLEIRHLLGVLRNDVEAKSVSVAETVRARCVVLAQQLAVVEYVARVKGMP